MEMTQHQRSRITATTTQHGARGVTQSLKASVNTTYAYHCGCVCVCVSIGDGLTAVAASERYLA